jgi:hypothetical protein
MTVKDQLMQIIEQSPESLLEEVLNFTLLLQEKYDAEELTQWEQVQIAEARKAYEAGDYMTLEEYESIQA